MDELAPHVLRFALGLFGGAILGALARSSRFCTLGAVEDAVYARDWTRLRAWALAAAAATATTQYLAFSGRLDLAPSLYQTPEFLLLGLPLGGYLFGLGMALVGTCGFGTLLRFGGGDLRALLTLLILAVAAYATMRGLPGLFRIHVIEAFALDLGAPGRQGLGTILGNPAAVAGAAVALMVVFAIWRGSLLRDPWTALAALGIGLVVAGGWWSTAIVGADPFDPQRPASHTFVAPVGHTLLYVMTATGSRLDFAHGSVIGVVLGALVAALLAREFRWEAYDDAREMRRHVIGAALMGFGGVTALGCTIGQGISGISTLSLGSVIALVSILAGARCGLYWLIERPLARE